MAKLRHIAITVPDPWKAAEFYMRAFGMEKVGETDWENARGVYLSDGTINLALLHYKTEEAAGKRGRDFVGVHHFGFLVDDVDAAMKAVEAAGATHWMGEPSGGSQVLRGEVPRPRRHRLRHHRERLGRRVEGLSPRLPTSFLRYRSRLRLVGLLVIADHSFQWTTVNAGHFLQPATTAIGHSVISFPHGRKRQKKRGLSLIFGYS